MFRFVRTLLKMKVKKEKNDEESKKEKNEEMMKKIKKGKERMMK